MDPTETWLCDDVDAAPLHTRTITMDCYASGDSLEAVGRLTDARHGAPRLIGVGIIHDMELRLRVEMSSMTITAVRAEMHSHPHLDCSDIEPAFQQLVGLSIMRGYTKRVQELLGRERGCAHLGFLARALGPIVIQGVTSAGVQERPLAEVASGAQEQPWMKNTCHIWADGGPGAVKLELGWKPGTVYPVPRVETLRAEVEERARAAGAGASPASRALGADGSN
jgi:hypothetical protein